MGQELLQLEAAIGTVSKGLTREQIKSFPKYEYMPNDRSREDNT